MASRLFFLNELLTRPNIFDYAIKNDFLHFSFSKILESIKSSLGLGLSGKNWQLFNASFQT